LINILNKGKFMNQFSGVLIKSLTLPQVRTIHFLETYRNKKESVKIQILKDIPRTFSNLDIFGYASALQKLYRILYSCFLYDPQLGYTQGMNMVAGALLMHTDESIAFWLFIILLEDYDVRDVFTHSHESIKKH